MKVNSPDYIESGMEASKVLDDFMKRIEHYEVWRFPPRRSLSEPLASSFSYLEFLFAFSISCYFSQEVYVTLNETTDRELPFIKIVDTGDRFIVNRIRGFHILGFSSFSLFILIKFIFIIVTKICQLKIHCQISYNNVS